MKIFTQPILNDIVPPTKNPSSIQPIVIKPTSPSKPNIPSVPPKRKDGSPPKTINKSTPPKTSPSKPNIPSVPPPAPSDSSPKPINKPIPPKKNDKPRTTTVVPIKPKPPIIETFWKCASQCQNKFYTFDDYYYNRCWDCVVNCSKRFPNSHTYGFCDCKNYSSYFYNGKTVCQYRKGDPPHGGHDR